MRLQVRNFQSVKEADIEVDGLTTLTGESSNGKSAVLRAVRAVLQNPSGAHCIHKGEMECRVTLENEGHEAQWVKTNAQTLYRIDGEEFTKLNRAVPEQISILGFGEISAGKESFYPQVFRQFDKPFILSEASPSTIAELLASSKESQQIARANKIAQDELRQRNSEVKVLEDQIKGQLSSLKVLGDCSRFLAEYQRRAIKSEEDYRIVKGKFEQFCSVVSRWRRANQILEGTGLTKQLPTGVLDDGKVQALMSVWSRYKRHSGIQQISLPSVVDQGPQKLGEKFGSCTALQHRYRAAKTKASLKLCSCETLDLEAPLSKLSKLNASRLGQRRAFHSRDTSMVELAQIMEDIKVNEHENSRMLKTLGYCPICNSRKAS